MYNIGQVISTHRKQKRLSQIELAHKLDEYGIHVKNAAVSSWERGGSMPSAEIFLALCQILKISDIYTEFIGENPYDPFKDLNDIGIQKAYEYIDLLRKSGDYKTQSAKVIPFSPRIMKVSLISASAGTGNFLDDENFEEMEIYDHVPPKADFGVYLDGDSMEPRFKNDELVWIEKTDFLDSGEIGLFFLDGLTYFKKLVKKETGTFLVSLNAKYKPIPVKEFSSFKIFGKLAMD